MLPRDILNDHFFGEKDTLGKITKMVRDSSFISELILYRKL